MGVYLEIIYVVRFQTIPFFGDADCTRSIDKTNVVLIIWRTLTIQFIVLHSFIMVMILLVIAMLLLSGHGVRALNSTSWAYCRVYPDPHFTTVRFVNMT